MSVRAGWLIMFSKFSESLQIFSLLVPTWLPMKTDESPTEIIDLFIFSALKSFSSCILKPCYWMHTHLVLLCLFDKSINLSWFLFAPGDNCSRVYVIWYWNSPSSFLLICVIIFEVGFFLDICVFTF